MNTNVEVYVMQIGDTVKVGHTKDLAARSHQLRGNRPVVVHRTGVLEHGERVERMAHKLLRLRGLQANSGDYFNASVDEAVGAINVACMLVDGCGWHEVVDRASSEKLNR